MESRTLEEFNHWWIRGKVDPDLALPFKRDIYAGIKSAMKSRFILSITGLRRIGKSTILYQLISDLIGDGVDATNILFFSFDEAQAKIGEVLDSYMGLQKKDPREERVYVFFDEIQKCTSWENEIKKYYDLYPKMKFVISGSESLFIRRRTKETLAGRIFEFTLGTFAFAEYLRFHKVEEKDFKYEAKINPLFERFIEYGGFPETFRADGDKEFKEYIQALVVDKIVYRDIPRLFKIDDPEFMRTMLEAIATNPGMYVDYQSLSRQFGKDRRVIKSYISYLKESFLIRMIGNYRKGSIPSLRKQKRAYPADNAITRLYKAGIDSDFFGRMVETAAINKLRADAFWKDGREVDIVYEGRPIEVKYKESIKSEDFASLREFMSRFGQTSGVMVTKREERVADLKEGKIRMIPARKFMLDGV